MDSTRKCIIEASLNKIAEAEGISVEDVRQEIALAISCALKSDNAEMKMLWKSIPTENTSPTVDEVIDYLVVKLAQDMLHD